jgi:dihydroorotate dehydrogenase
MEVQVLPNLRLADPFMIASSHLTGNENCFKQLVPFAPSAVTLKTTSVRYGGDGTSTSGSRWKQQLKDSSGNSFATYTDGPKMLELLDIATTYILTQRARQHLPNTKLGLSVLFGEDYGTIISSLKLDEYSYVELNLKYSFRQKSIADIAAMLQNVDVEISDFISAFGPLPVLVKLPREAIDLLNVVDFSYLFSMLNSRGAGVIVANSRRVAVSPSRNPHKSPRELLDGVVVGEHLFLDTYNAIKTIYNADVAPTIVASGGIVDAGGVVDVIAAGASAVQLCTVVDLHGHTVLRLLRDQLAHLMGNTACLKDFADELRSDQSIWTTTVIKSRDFRISEEKIVQDLFQADELVIDIFTDVLSRELDGVEAFHFDGEAPERSEALRLAFSRGNISSFLIGKFLCDEPLINPLEFNSVGDFRSAIRNDGFMYDLAIIPESGVRTLLDLEGLGERAPGTIAAIARSVFELVGKSPMELNEVQWVNHFKGSSSRVGLQKLLVSCHPKLQELDGSHVLPLLRCWSDRHAILAKPPLTSLYGLFTQKDVREAWGTIWEEEEPIILVASQRFLSSKSGVILANAIAARINDVRAQVLSDRDRSARRARSEGFLDHCARLISGEVKPSSQI